MSHSAQFLEPCLELAHDAGTPGAPYSPHNSPGSVSNLAQGASPLCTFENQSLPQILSSASDLGGEQQSPVPGQEHREGGDVKGRKGGETPGLDAIHLQWTVSEGKDQCQVLHLSRVVSTKDIWKGGVEGGWKRRGGGKEWIAFGTRQDACKWQAARSCLLRDSKFVKGERFM